MSNLRYVFISLLLFMLIPLHVNAEMLSLGGKRVEVVDGTISDADAKQVIEYCKIKYKRGEYKDVKNTLEKLNSLYKGKMLPELYFVLAKDEFMLGRYATLGELFLRIYDEYPNYAKKNIKQMQNVLAKALTKLKNNLDGKDYLETIARRRFNVPHMEVDSIVYLNYVYKYIGGSAINAIDNFITRRHHREVDFTAQDVLPMCSSGDYLCFYHNQKADYKDLIYAVEYRLRVALRNKIRLPIIKYICSSEAPSVLSKIRVRYSVEYNSREKLRVNNLVSKCYPWFHLKSNNVEGKFKYVTPDFAHMSTHEIESYRNKITKGELDDNFVYMADGAKIVAKQIKKMQAAVKFKKWELSRHYAKGLEIWQHVRNDFHAGLTVVEYPSYKELVDAKYGHALDPAFSPDSQL